MYTVVTVMYYSLEFYQSPLSTISSPHHLTTTQLTSQANINSKFWCIQRTNCIRINQHWYNWINNKIWHVLTWVSQGPFQYLFRQLYWKSTLICELYGIKTIYIYYKLLKFWKTTWSINWRYQYMDIVYRERSWNMSANCVSELNDCDSILESTPR